MSSASADDFLQNLLKNTVDSDDDAPAPKTSQPAPAAAPVNAPSRAPSLAPLRTGRPMADEAAAQERRRILDGLGGGDTGQDSVSRSTVPSELESLLARMPDDSDPGAAAAAATGRKGAPQPPSAKRLETTADEDAWQALVRQGTGAPKASDASSTSVSQGAGGLLGLLQQIETGTAPAAHSQPKVQPQTQPQPQSQSQSQSQPQPQPQLQPQPSRALDATQRLASAQLQRSATGLALPAPYAYSTVPPPPGTTTRNLRRDVQALGALLATVDLAALERSSSDGSLDDSFDSLRSRDRSRLRGLPSPPPRSIAAAAASALEGRDRLAGESRRELGDAYNKLERRVLNSPNFSSALRALRLLASIDGRDERGSQNLWMVLARATQSLARMQFGLTGAESVRLVDAVAERATRSRRTRAARASLAGTDGARAESAELTALRAHVARTRERLAERMASLQAEQLALENRLAVGDARDGRVPASLVASVDAHYKRIYALALRLVERRRAERARLVAELDEHTTGRGRGGPSRV